MSKKFILLFISINCLLTGFYVDTWDNGNSTSRMLSVMCAVQSGSLQIDAQQERTIDKSFINGHYYSDKAPLPTFLVIPVYKLFTLCGYEEDGEGTLIYILGDIICGMIPFILILYLSLRAAFRQRLLSAVYLTMLPLYGSFIFIYAGSFYNHLLSALFLLLAYLFLKKEKHFMAGLFIGFGFMSEFIIALIILLWGILLLIKTRSVKNFFLYSLGTLPSVFTILIYNFFLTGSPFTMVYKFHHFEQMNSSYGFAHPSASALWGITFSQYKGLFFYAPFLLFCLYYFIKELLQLRMINAAKQLLNYPVIASVGIVLALSSYFSWWGGWVYGPRLVTFLAVLLSYKGIEFIRDKKIWVPLFYLLVLFGCLCAFSAKITVLYSIPSEIKYPFNETILPAIFHSNFNANNIATICFGLSPISAAVLWVFLFAAGAYVLNKNLSSLSEKKEEGAVST